PAALRLPRPPRPHLDPALRGDPLRPAGAHPARRQRRPDARVLRLPSPRLRHSADLARRAAEPDRAAVLHHRPLQRRLLSRLRRCQPPPWDSRAPCVTRDAMDTIILDIAERVATITLNRPDRLNAMNQQMRDELRTCWQRVKDDPDIWVAIVTGAGRAFSSGADVESLAGGGFKKPHRWRQLAMHRGTARL